MPKITMAATTEVKVGDAEYVEVEVEVEGDPADDGQAVAFMLADALAALEEAQFDTRGEEPAPDVGGSSAPAT